MPGDWLLVGLLIAIRIVLSLSWISLPGLQQDEVLFVNSATLRLPGIFLAHQLLGVPVMVFPYIGALKSWLYAPIFSLFGESATSIRLPAELIASAGLVALYPALRSLISRPVALLSVALLCFDNSLFWLTRDDVGPNAIDFFLKCAAILCVARLWRTERLRWLVLLLVTLGLGVFNKLNFIWVVNAAVAVSVVIGVVHRSRVRQRPAWIATWVIGLAVIYGAFGAYYVTQHIGSINAAPPHTDVLARNWPIDLGGTEAVVSGTWFFGYALGHLEPRMLVVWISFALFGIGTVASVLRGRTRSLPVACLALTTVLLYAQLLVTYQATAGWHYIAIYPFAVVVAAHGAWALLAPLRLSQAKVAMALGLLAVAAFAYDGILMGKYFNQLGREPRFSAWSPAIYRLSNFLRHQPGTVWTADWGILPSLFALEPSTRYHSLGFALTNSAPANLRAVASGLAAAPGPKLIVAHVPRAAILPNVNTNLQRTERGHLQRIATIRGQRGVPVYTVYLYR